MVNRDILLDVFVFIVFLRAVKKNLKKRAKKDREAEYIVLDEEVPCDTIVRTTDVDFHVHSQVVGLMFSFFPVVLRNKETSVVNCEEDSSVAVKAALSLAYGKGNEVEFKVMGEEEEENFLTFF